MVVNPVGCISAELSVGIPAGIPAVRSSDTERVKQTERPIFISKRELRSLYVISRPSVVCLSVTFVHPTQANEIFSNVSTPFGTQAIC